MESEYKNYKEQTTTKEKESNSIINELDNKNSEKEKEILSMKSELSEIKSINEEYEEKIKDNESKILDLTTRNQTLEAQMLQAINMPKLLKEVREVLAHKGFISEMEFENIMKQL